MRITSKGQVTIPVDIREKAGFLPHTEVEFIMDGNEVRIVTATGNAATSRGAEVVARLKNRATAKLSTDQIMALTRDR